MVNMELLSAISDMMDAKFDAFERKMDMKMDAKLAPVIERLDSMDKRMDSMDKRMDSMDKRMDSMDKRMDSMDKRLESIDSRVKKLEILTENVIIPRIKQIESCYLSTFERYKKYCERMETVFNDVEILKITVHEHSERLKLTS